MEIAGVREALRTNGYFLLRGQEFPRDPNLHECENGLAAQWDDLDADRYLKAGARFRERRYSRFSYVPRSRTVTLLPHRPYFQSPEANSYAGGMRRDVAALSPETLHNPLLEALIHLNFAQFPVAAEAWDRTWEIQCHQFRIIGRSDEAGEPTPEGPHRDEIDFGAIHLIGRSNATGGLSQVYSNDRQPLTEFCLTEPMDTMYWADRSVLHAVTPVDPVDPARPAIRDILIFGYEAG